MNGNADSMLRLAGSLAALLLLLCLHGARPATPQATAIAASTDANLQH